MMRVTFLLPDGNQIDGEGAEGASVMELAKKLGIAGVVAECAGSCACATCQVEFDDHWFGVVGESGDDEREMLEMAVSAGPTSRLSCQIALTSALDGLVVMVPEEQG